MAKAKVVAQETVAQATEKKVTFNRAEFATTIIKAFAKNGTVDVVADTDLEKPRDTSVEEMAYIHFFKKGTDKDLFKMYNMPKKTRFAVSKVTELPESDEYTISPIINSKTQTVKWINIYTAHENAIEVARMIIDAAVAGAEKIEAEKAVKKAAKDAEKQAQKEAKKAEKSAEQKKTTTTKKATVKKAAK